MTSPHPDAASARPEPYDAAVVSDLSAHAWEQMRPAMVRAVNLGDTKAQQVQVAVMIATLAIGAAAGAFGKLNGLDDTDDAVREASLAIIDMIREQTAGMAAARGPASPGHGGETDG